MEAQWTANLYRIFRTLLGAYLFVHFAHLVFWGTEVFSSAGMLTPGSASPLLGLFPNVLAISDAPWAVTSLILAGSVAALLFMAGRFDKPAAFVMWYILACLFARNPLIANPALPYLGWMLLAHLFIPQLPPISHADPRAGWHMPRSLFIAAWIVLALSYSYSGYTKLLSPSWVSGDTVAYVLENPLARDYFLRDLFLALPHGALQMLTWTILYVELLFAPLALVRQLRPILWSVMLLVQIGFLCLLNFADLTAPMLLFHLPTFDPAWIRAARARASETIYYDGHCGLCHRVVRFVLAEDQGCHFRFAPLQGSTFAGALAESVRRELPDSFVVVDDEGNVKTRSDAVVHMLRRLGGFWLVIGGILSGVPKPLRDLGYMIVGRIRHRLYPRPEGICPVLPAELRVRFGQ